MSNKRDIHVVPHKKGGWAKKSEGSSRAGSLHRTQTDAVERARSQAIRNKSEVVIHRPDGRIRDSDSYGKDPCPPKDKKY